MFNSGDVRDVIILGRGGQGGVTASRILVSAAVRDGLWGQAIPEFGAERRGALVKSYARISARPITLHSAVDKADYLVVLSPDILGQVDLMSLAKGPDSIAIVNSPQPVKAGLRSFYIDATGISEKLGLIMAGWHIVSTAMLGALVKVTELVTLKSLMDALGDYITRPDLLKLNIEAVRLGYINVRGV